MSAACTRNGPLRKNLKFKTRKAGSRLGTMFRQIPRAYPMTPKRIDDIVWKEGIVYHIRRTNIYTVWIMINGRKVIWRRDARERSML